MPKRVEERYFTQIQSVGGFPDLLGVSKESYQEFFQKGIPYAQRKRKGLKKILEEVFPITGRNGKIELHCIDYEIEEPYTTEEECLRKGLTYSARVELTTRLYVYKSVKRKEISSIREEKVYLGEFPLMTERGTFIVNGVERVVVSQLHRSPGVIFESLGTSRGKELFSGRIIPDRGIWLEFSTDYNDFIYVSVGRRRRMWITTFLRAIGFSRDEDIIRAFYTVDTINLESKRAPHKALGKILAEDVIDPDSGEVLLESKSKVEEEHLKIMKIKGVKKIKVIRETSAEDLMVINTLRKDEHKTEEEALSYVYSRLRPGNPFEIETARAYIFASLFDRDRFDLSRIGRYRLNRRFGFDTPLDEVTLRIQDIIAAIKELQKLAKGEAEVDDVDHLGNRRVRRIGDLLENQTRVALLRMARMAQERTLLENEGSIMPHDLINPRILNNTLNEFFARSQLSQFLDQTNPLAELTHKRRLSCLGPEGLSRERAGIEVRDVHPTHYGRVCPIETPEGQNIGLITSLATYARVNELGLLVTPYRKVKKGVVTDEIQWLAADEEDNFVIAQANAPVDKNGKFEKPEVLVRYRGDFLRVEREKVDYMDVTPMQTVSVATSLIPFLEHDDSNRALMGSNMQRQAVPPLFPEAPLVQTGMERVAAKDSGAVVVSQSEGIVEEVNSEIIIVREERKEGFSNFRYYPLKKFTRTNQSTCFHQRPLVKKGDRVKKGDILADGPATRKGKLALGKNVLVAFMPWEGYNFEDAILISEKLVEEDVYTSVHIEDFSLECRETKLGREEITRDLPNVGEEELANLDEDGIIRIGAYVKPGDILVGKVTPKGETVTTSEEKLLRAIFGEKASDVINKSLRVPPGVSGVVIDVKVFSREEKDIEKERKNSPEVAVVKRKYSALKNCLDKERERKIKDILLGKKLSKDFPVKKKEVIAKGTVISQDILEKISDKNLKRLKIGDPEVESRIEAIEEEYKERIKEFKKREEEEIKKLVEVEELPPGVIKKVKVYVASKRKVQEGDKLSGRHGNKGVVARVLPKEDMPYLPDGTPVEIVLNPLGVPSRMNLGQLLETHLGWAAKVLGCEAITPVFNGAREEDIKKILEEAGLPGDGKTVLYDGRTGDPFYSRVMVGYIYMMKLVHMVEDKVHARATGPYSLVTQQPLGGKAQFGGQRFGEMEVWALEAYGAAYTLQEMLTVKSDDIEGRSRIYEAIVKRENALVPTIPESFNVLVKELQGLCLDVKVEKARGAPPEEGVLVINRGRSEVKSVALGLASPHLIRSWSYGEVKKPETLNYRTLRPERDGLFCEKIFGPTRDWECYCGKYKRIKHKGVVCERCGVEVTLSKVRRERMGHINLVTPVAHIWFFKVVPSVMGTLLDVSLPNLERVIYYDAWIVIDPGDTPLKKYEVLREQEYQEAKENYGERFRAGMGAPAIREILQDLDLAKLAEELRKAEKLTHSRQQKWRINRRLKLVEAFRKSNQRPEWMILEVVPVIPPNLRPLVPLDKGGFATSDLNDLYRRLINRNNRLRKLMEMGAPDIILRNEKRMLQEAVDALFDNGRRGRAVVDQNGRPLKSLANTLGGKHGRFRQNLLGKRVDYSGRSVIVVDPRLKLHQCGVPKIMALELFQPFIIRDLREKGYVHTIKAGKNLIEKGTPEVWEALEEVIKGHPVLLNRAPTLHRISIQSFFPILHESKTIRIHPLVCSAYNADFDGDTMSIFVPLSMEALLESQILMLSPNNLFSPADGRPVVTPSQDIVLGTYYLTIQDPSMKEARYKFYYPGEVLLAYDMGSVKLHETVLLRQGREFIETTPGRVLFNSLMPEGLSFVNEPMTKSKLTDLIAKIIEVKGRDKTVEFLDDLKELGFHYATIAGISMAISDVKIPGKKWEIIKKAQVEAEKIDRDYRKGVITQGERYNRVVDLWTRVSDEIADLMLKALASDPFNPVHMMMASEARGSAQQIRQLGGMRGLIARPRRKLVGAIGEIIETPILTNFREGLTVLEYFISTHGGRKGLADTALKTAEAGYLTRRLVDVAQDIVVREEDCGTLNGIIMRPLEVGGKEIIPLKDRITGRFSLEDIRIPSLGNIIVKAGEEITADKAEIIEEAGVEEIPVRSVLTCETKGGICQRCYGRDLATGEIVEVGQAVGIMAAQAIGEPGTQLTLRTFHIGGMATRIIGENQYIAQKGGTVKYINLKVIDKEKEKLVLNRNGWLVLADPEGREVEKFKVPVGASIKVKEGKEVEEGVVLIEWDPYVRPFLSEIEGKIIFEEMIPDVTFKEEVNRETGLREKVIIEHRPQFQPALKVKNEETGEERLYPLPINTHIVVEDGQNVKPGDILAKSMREVVKATDITGGLPRVSELFEARKPKDPAGVTEINGVVKSILREEKERRIVIEGEDGEIREYKVPPGKHIEVDVGDRVEAGQKLTDGPPVLQEMLRIEGERKLQYHLLNEIQEVYRLQGVRINDKHIEVIVRQMLRKVQVEDPGDTEFLWGEQVDKFRFQEENERVVANGGKPAQARPLVLGITKASLSSDSFIAAASFQETSRVLTRASVSAQRDPLKGIKENVIIGNLVPAGTGWRDYREVEVIKNANVESVSEGGETEA
ncbi:MAG: DNA-directed RNA polymerase subunit beta [Caldiserica bacterium]|nr:DNA-directed RNA polymerase subunit beta [Caldisericota bacterium]